MGSNDHSGKVEIWGSNPQPKDAIAKCCCRLANRNEERFPGFLQVMENWKKSGNLCGQGRSGENIFVKVSENEKLVPPDVRFSG